MEIREKHFRCIIHLYLVFTLFQLFPFFTVKCFLWVFLTVFPLQQRQQRSLKTEHYLIATKPQKIYKFLTAPQMPKKT